MYGDFVRELRLSRGMTQQALADNTGIAQSNIAAIESGRRSPSTETLHALVTGCGYLLAAVAGERQLTLDPPPDESLPFELSDPIDRVEPLTEEDHRRRLHAVLEASEAIIRSRSR